MLRSEILQAVLDSFSDPKYLEIGVSQGVTFDQIIAPYKVAVDPYFQFDLDAAQLKDRRCYYHVMTSDQFFQTKVMQHGKFDLIFLDGLHTFEQTLRDLLNALAYLKAGGVVVIDDVTPISYSSSLRDEREGLMVKRLVPHEADGAWMGDVYRLVFFIESFLVAFSYASVADNNNHQLVLWREQRQDAAASERTLESTARLEFAQILALPESYRAKPLAQILDDIRNASARARTETVAVEMRAR
jgi:hypothetical protein